MRLIFLCWFVFFASYSFGIERSFIGSDDGGAKFFYDNERFGVSAYWNGKNIYAPDLYGMETNSAILTTRFGRVGIDYTNPVGSSYTNSFYSLVVSEPGFIAVDCVFHEYDSNLNGGVVRNGVCGLNCSIVDSGYESCGSSWISSWNRDLEEIDLLPIFDSGSGVHEVDYIYQLGDFIYLNRFYRKPEDGGRRFFSSVSTVLGYFGCEIDFGFKAVFLVFDKENNGDFGLIVDNGDNYIEYDGFSDIFVAGDLDFDYSCDISKLESILRDIDISSLVFDDHFIFFILNEYPVDNYNVVYYNNSAYYLWRIGKYESAIYLLEAITKKFPDRVVAYINLGDAYWGLDQQDEARSAYQTYIRLMRENNREQRIPQRVFERVNEPALAE